MKKVMSDTQARVAVENLTEPLVEAKAVAIEPEKEADVNPLIKVRVLPTEKILYRGRWYFGAQELEVEDPLAFYKITKDENGAEGKELLVEVLGPF